MAFGFPASFSQQLVLNGSRLAAREATTNCLRVLRWSYQQTGPDVFEVRIPMSGSSWGELFSVSLASSGLATVKSRCRFPLQIFDWGKNRQNVKEFVSRFVIKDEREAKFDIDRDAFFQQNDSSPLERVLKEAEEDG